MLHTWSSPHIKLMISIFPKINLGKEKDGTDKKKIYDDFDSFFGKS